MHHLGISLISVQVNFFLANFILWFLSSVSVIRFVIIMLLTFTEKVCIRNWSMLELDLCVYWSQNQTVALHFAMTVILINLCIHQGYDSIVAFSIR